MRTDLRQQPTIAQGTPPMSPDDDREIRRSWAETWTRADTELSAIKQRELRDLDTRVALAQLADAFEHALRNAPSAETSGLVVQQRFFARLRR